MNNQVYSTFQLAKKNRDLKTMERLYLANKSDIYIKFEYAKLLNRYGKKREAYVLFKVLSFNNCYALFELGKLEFEFKNIDEARRIFNSLLNTKTGLYALFELGKLEMSVGNINYARKCFKDILKEKKDIFAMLELGKLELSIGDVNKARKLFLDILEIKDDSYAKFELGKLEMSVGNFELAHKYFTELLTCQNKYYAELELGKLDFLMGNVDIAKKHLYNLLNTSDSRGAILELGIIEYYLGNVKEAFKYFDKLLHTDSEEYGLFSLINMLIKEGYVSEAFEYFNYSKKKGYYCDPKCELYLMKYFNIYFVSRCNVDYSYNNLQLLDYDEYVAVEHIISRHKKDFFSDVDIYKLFNSIREKISREYYIGKLVLNDIYDIPYKGIGMSDTLRVICLPGTKDILSMYPLTNKFDYEEDVRLEKIK